MNKNGTFFWKISKSHRIAALQRAPESVKEERRLEDKKIPRHIHQVVFDLRDDIFDEELVTMNTYSRKIQKKKPIHKA